jgi:hypothetical protein
MLVLLGNADEHNLAHDMNLEDTTVSEGLG